jgi:hypothetical protein
MEVQVNSSERAEPIEERGEQAGRVGGLANSVGENRTGLGLHRPAMTSRAQLQTPLHRVIQVTDIQCCQ